MSFVPRVMCLSEVPAFPSRVLILKHAIIPAFCNHAISCKVGAKRKWKNRLGDAVVNPLKIKRADLEAGSSDTQVTPSYYAVLISSQSFEAACIGSLNSFTILVAAPSPEQKLRSKRGGARRIRAKNSADSLKCDSTNSNKPKF